MSDKKYEAKILESKGRKIEYRTDIGAKLITSCSV